jgi:hypothetical protein
MSSSDNDFILPEGTLEWAERFHDPDEYFRAFAEIRPTEALDGRRSQEYARIGIQKKLAEQK